MEYFLNLQTDPQINKLFASQIQPIRPACTSGELSAFRSIECFFSNPLFGSVAQGIV